MLRLLLSSLLVTSAVLAQGGPAAHIISGPILPTRCSPKSGDVWFRTSPVASVYYCIATNTWAFLGISGKTFVGTATQIPLFYGTPTGNKCVQTDTDGNLVETGGVCASAGGDVYLAVANTFTRGQTVIGATDETQLKVKGKSSQTSPILDVQTSAGVSIIKGNEDGTVELASGTGPVELTAVAAPSTPGAGKLDIWGDSTNKGLWAKDDAGTASRTAQVTSATAGQCFSAFNNDGTFTKYTPTVNYSPGASFYNGGSDLTAGMVFYYTAPYACTISAFNIVVDAGTITMDVWKIATGTAKPTVANTITASAKPALSTGTALHSTTLTGWTTSVTKNDIFAFYVDTVSGVKNLDFGLECNQ